MSETATHEPSLLYRRTALRQVSATDAATLQRAQPPVANEEDVIRAGGAGVWTEFCPLEDIEPDRELLSLFPARVLLKEELLPLRA